jgi:hypothetical protein
MTVVSYILRSLAYGIIMPGNLWTGCHLDLIANLHTMKKDDVSSVDTFVMTDAVREEHG